jgi:Flp pilus assembly protein TadD
MAVRRFWLSLALLVSVTVAAQQQPTTANIVGTVSVARANFPPHRIEVKLVTRGMTLTSAYTNDEGRFAFYDLPPNLYHVSVDDPAFESVGEIVSVDPLQMRNYMVNFRLTPRDDNPSTPRAQVTGGNARMVSVTDYGRDIPRKALKEFEAGARAEREKQRGKAVAHYQKALEIYPGFYAARNNLGSIYLDAGDFEGARSEFEQVVKVNQSDSAAYFNLANVYLLTRRYPDALTYANAGLQKEPDSALGNFILGSIYGATGRELDAEHALLKALQLDGSLLRARLALVNVYLAEGRSAEAADQLRLFLKLSPDDPLAPHAKQVLARLTQASK